MPWQGAPFSQGVRPGAHASYFPSTVGLESRALVLPALVTLVLGQLPSRWRPKEGTKSLGQVTNWTGGVAAGNVVPPAVRHSCFSKDVPEGGLRSQPYSGKELPGSPMAGQVVPSMSGGVAVTNTMDTRKGSHSRSA